MQSTSNQVSAAFLTDSVLAKTQLVCTVVVGRVVVNPCNKPSTTGMQAKHVHIPYAHWLPSCQQCCTLFGAPTCASSLTHCLSELMTQVLRPSMLSNDKMRLFTRSTMAAVQCAPSCTGTMMRSMLPLQSQAAVRREVQGQKQR